MSRIATLLEALAKIAVEGGELNRADLQDGLSRTELKKLLVEHSFPVKAPDAWIQAYEWRNGTVDDGCGKPRHVTHVER